MLKLTGIHQITLRVNDLRVSEDFYMNILGFKLHHRLGMNMTYLQAGDDMLVIVRAETPSPNDARDIRVDHFGLKLNTDAEVDEAAEKLRECNVHLLTSPANRRDGRAFFILDPDGNMIEIYSSTGAVFSSDDTNPDAPSSSRRGRKARSNMPTDELLDDESEENSALKRRRSRK
ncbi:Glyoxalase/bleomycin resistance protein/dioxygenase [Chloroherpeton thalassium ATCC 35110]|uniref:Glyoxalase/bleomycin resistance protein/dioxygenase n=1 Tax=Chloroherpeton thalassium (strain ATCC 35110 / GB-78) TaxID=517418 RepID=B3QXA2_CHLT3|nr:VOC family protein [Chloroherpeton thalassium]ACF13376.1 Glyoxalase/bleomycin resistance protein/dioxygenase [Chloroherpeton thalassium ATCC 35110]